MKNKAVALCCAVILVAAFAAVAIHAQAPANVAGTWTMSSQGRNGVQTTTLTITQDGATIKGTAQGGQGAAAPLEGTVSGNSVTFAITRAGRDGNAMKMEYKATVSGGSMKGTVGQNATEFTANKS